MAAWYSDVFHSTGSGSTTTTRTIGHQVANGRQCGPRKIATLNLTGVTTMVNTDVLVMQPVRPNERLLALHVQADAVFNGSTTLTVDVGLWKLTASGDLGDVIDANLFDDDLALDAVTVANVDVFAANDLANTDRGKRFWELAHIGAATYTEGPNEVWAIGFLFNLSGTVTGGLIQTIAEIYPG